MLAINAANSVFVQLRASIGTATRLTRIFAFNLDAFVAQGTSHDLDL